MATSNMPSGVGDFKLNTPCPTCGDSVSLTAKKMAEVQTCPKCGRQFSVIFARVFACQGCREAVLSCPMLRCPLVCGKLSIVKDGKYAGRVDGPDYRRYML